MRIDDEKWPVAPDPKQPPPGTYLVSYRGFRFKERYERNNIELDFVIIEPYDWKDTVVKMYFPLPLDGKLSRLSKYYKWWCFANRQPPNRRDRMTPKVFHGYWSAELVYSKQVQTDTGVRRLEPHEEGQIRVERLIERVAGRPVMTTIPKNAALVATNAKP